MLGKRRYRKIVSSNKKGIRAEDGRHFRYQNKDDPSYQKPYGKEYTVRQLQILSGEVEWETTSIRDLTRLLYKAEMLNDTEVYQKVKRMRDLRIEQRDRGYTPNISADEAREILRSLTPWEINKKV